MGEVCSSCGKADHFGGCKIGPNTQQQNEALEAYSRKPKPKCGICMGFDHETPHCPKATNPVTDLKGLDIGEVIVDELPAMDPLADFEDPDKDFLYIGGLHPQMADLLRECREVQRVKGGDYTQKSKDRLANFRRESVKWNIPIEKAWGVYFDKHLCAIETYVLHGGQKESEPIRGRIVDAINYLLLFYLIVREKDPEAA